MAWNQTAGCIDYPNKLVWSTSAEIQQLLSDVPLIALGVLGLASAMLLLLTDRLTPASICISVGTLFGFAAGFFDMLSLLQGSTDHSAGPRSPDNTSHGLDTVSDTSMSILISTSLLFLFLRALGVAKEEAASSMSSKPEDAFSWQTKALHYQKRLLTVLSNWIVHCVVLAYLVVITALDIVWRRILAQRKESFSSIFVASTSLQLIFLVFVAILLFGQFLIHGIDRLRIYRVLPLLTGTLIAISPCFAGFAVHAFIETPLARLLLAVQIYIWLLDVLYHAFDVSTYMRTLDMDEKGIGRCIDWQRVTPGRRTTGPPEVPSKHPWRLSTPSLGANPLIDPSIDTQSPYSSNTSPQQGTAQETPAKLSVGPTIRRSSRLPSWLLPVRSGSIKSIETAGLRADWQKEDEEAANSAGAWEDRKDYPIHIQFSGRSSDREEMDSANGGYSPSILDGYGRAISGDVSKGQNLPKVVSFKNALHNRSRSNPHRKTYSVPSILSSSAGTYNEQGIRLDSPMEVDIGATPTGFGITSPAATRPAGDFQKKPPQQAPPAVTQKMEEVPRPIRPLRDPMIRNDSSSTGSSKSFIPPVRQASPAVSTTTRHPSVSSKTSSVSLSHFPRPPSGSGTATRTARQSLRNTILRRNSALSGGTPPEEMPVVPDLKATPEEEEEEPPLRPPVMPAATAGHHHTDSWQSNDTLPDSLRSDTPPVGQRGYNITSFIGTSAGSDSSSERLQQAQADHQPKAKAQILRASSITRQSARLLTRLTPPET